MFSQPLTRAPRYILIKSFFLAISWSSLYGLSDTHVFKKIETIVSMKWNCMPKALRFIQITAEHKRLSMFYRIYNHKNFIPKYLDNALTDFAETDKHRGGSRSKKFPWTILEQFPVPRNMTRHRGQKYLCEFVYNLCEFINNVSLSKITSYNTFTTLLLGLRLSASFTWLLTKYVQLVCQTNHLSIYSHNF